jgi:WD40 repeat protein
VLSVAFTPDGGHLLVGGDAAPYLRLYHVASGTVLRQPFRGHESWVNHVAISPNGLRALSAGNDGTVRLWELAGGSQVGQPARHDGPANWVAFSPDGRFALSGGQDKAIWLLSLSGPNPRPIFVRAPAAVGAVGFSPDGKQVLAIGEDQVVRLWDRDSRAEVRSFPVPGCSHAALSPDGRWVVAGGAGSVRLYDVSSGKLERAFLGPHRHVQWVSFAPDGGSALATDHQGQALYLWDTSSGELLHTFRGKHNLNRAVFSPDGRHVACGSFRGHVYLWDLSR